MRAPILSSALVLVLALSSAARAAFEETGAGARAPGMGNVFTAVADDVYAIHYNPAGLAQLTRPELGTSYTRLFANLSDGSQLAQNFIGYAHPIHEGKDGTAAASWEQFTLNSGLYQEQAISLGYARPLAKDLGPGDLFAGGTGKLLRRSFGAFPEASNAMNGILATGASDPALNGKRSAQAIDADLGLLYRFKYHYSVAAAFSHLPEPNVGFAGEDRVPRAARLGLNYRSLLSNVGAEYETQRSPIGTQDHTLGVAFERWFPKLFVGEFGLRGALTLGTRSRKDATAGASYRSSRVGVDYGFSMPLDSIAGTMGTHRIAFSLRFGALAEPEESMLMILDAMRRLKAGGRPDIKVLAAGLTPAQKAIIEERLALARSLEEQGKYDAALEQFSQAVAISPSDTDLLKRFGRLNWLAHLVKTMGDFRGDTIRVAWHEGNLDYLEGKDTAAVEKVATALSLAPGYRPLQGFLEQLELATGLKRPVVKGPRRNVKVEDLLAKAALALDAGRYEDAIALAKEALADVPSNAEAWEDLGTAYFALGDYTSSLGSWRRALALELDKSRKPTIESYIASLRKLVKKGQPAATEKAQPAHAAPSVSPQVLQKLYDEGVDFYTAGRLDLAKQTFEKVLEKDPRYVPAQKALRRVNEELQTTK